ELHDRVGLDDDVFRLRDLVAERGHSLGEHTLFGPNPKYALCAGDQEPRSVTLAAAVMFFIYRPGVLMFIQRAIARLGCHRADAMSELCDLDGQPVELGQSRN